LNEPERKGARPCDRTPSLHEAILLAVRAIRTGARAIGHRVHDRWRCGKGRRARGQQQDRCNQLLHDQFLFEIGLLRSSKKRAEAAGPIPDRSWRTMPEPASAARGRQAQSGPPSHVTASPQGRPDMPPSHARPARPGRSHADAGDSSPWAYRRASPGEGQPDRRQPRPSSRAPTAARA